MLSTKINNMFYIFIYIIFVFIISIPFLNKNLFLLDFSSMMNTEYILDLFYGKTIPEYGASFPIALITIIFQNALIFIILFLGVYSMNDFISSISPVKTFQFYASSLYVINPYVYIRILTGQIFLLFSYAVLPFLLKSFINLLEKKNKKGMIKFIFLLSLVSFSLHMLIVALILMIIIFLFWFNKNRDPGILKIIMLSVTLFILLNSYWIIPVLTAKNTIMDDIGEKDFEEYAPRIEGITGWFEIAAMYGFWREGFLYTKDSLPGWQILYLIILSLAIIGLIYHYKDENIGIYVKAFAVIGIVGFMLASGVNGPSGDIVRWLFDNTILKGFRDSHKFVAMMVLAYSVLGGLGLNKIKSVLDDK